MVDADTLLMVIDSNPCVARTHISEPGTSIRADGNPNATEIELELDPTASDADRDQLHDTATQNNWSVLTDWGTDVWLLIDSQ